MSKIICATAFLLCNTSSATMWRDLLVIIIIIIITIIIIIDHKYTVYEDISS